MKRRRLPTLDELLAGLVLVKLGQELGTDSSLARTVRAIIDLALAVGRF